FLHEMRVAAPGPAPVDRPRAVARQGGAILPELVTRARPPTAMRAQQHRLRQMPGIGQQRGQRGGKGFGRGAQVGGLGHAAASIRVTWVTTREITWGRFSPRARAAKVSAMRWVSTGAAIAATSST